jgi:EAL domain-containing protein (putative c-di-GMP-specific phosphodiesterase class I)
MHTLDADIGICFFDEEMREHIAREEIISRELTQIAGGEKTERLFLQYQPILDLETNRICGFEALARLNSEQLGRVPPLEFIPIAEKTKLIIPLGNEIILKAFHFSNVLKENGHRTVGVTINISAIQLMRHDFTENLIETAERMRIDPAYVILEITESVFATNYQEINRILGKLKEFGFRIAIDDFGTEYSSLARERELNVNCLKIDKYFIDKLLTLEPEQAITEDIISMGHKLGHSIIAEGIEYEKQLQYLKDHGCDKIQGYLIGKPLDEEAALEMIKDQKDLDHDFLVAGAR